MFCDFFFIRHSGHILRMGKAEILQEKFIRVPLIKKDKFCRWGFLELWMRLAVIPMHFKLNYWRKFTLPSQRTCIQIRLLERFTRLHLWTVILLWMLSSLCLYLPFWITYHLKTKPKTWISYNKNFLKHFLLSLFFMHGRYLGLNKDL